MLAQLFTATSLGTSLLAAWQVRAVVAAAYQDIPDPGLIKDIGLVGYLLLACVAALLAMGMYLVKKLVDALVDAQGKTAAAIIDITKSEAGQRQILEQLSAMLTDTRDAARAQLAIAQEWQKDGARVRDIPKNT